MKRQAMAAESRRVSALMTFSLSSILALVLWFAAASIARAASEENAPGIVQATSSAIITNAHSFGFDTASGGRIELAEYAGKAVLVVNTASQCSFTRQYGPLQTLYEKYRDRGLAIIAVPSNDFGGQEPGSDTGIIEFASREFEVSFPIAAKARVRGTGADPFYRWAGAQVGTLGQPRWNFHKYLIGPDGELVTWFSTFTEPDSDKLARAIEAALPPAYSPVISRPLAPSNAPAAGQFATE